MKGVKKQHLPEKICVSCGRPFTWRKKWEKVWDEVKYCSDRCRLSRPRERTANSSDAQLGHLDQTGKSIVLK